MVSKNLQAIEALEICWSTDEAILSKRKFCEGCHNASGVTESITEEWRVEETLASHIVQCLCSSRALFYSRLPRTMFKRLLNISKYGDFIISQGNLYISDIKQASHLSCTLCTPYSWTSSACKRSARTSSKAKADDSLDAIFIPRHSCFNTEAWLGAATLIHSFPDLKFSRWRQLFNFLLCMKESSCIFDIQVRSTSSEGQKAPFQTCSHWEKFNMEKLLPGSYQTENRAVRSCESYSFAWVKSWWRVNTHLCCN